MKVILISGKQGSGKSTLAKGLHSFFTEKKLPVHWIKFADPLYEMHAAVKEVAEEYGIPFEKKEGTLLQLLGTEWGRKVKGVDVWANACVTAVSNIEMNHPGSFYLIDDCRFLNELFAFYQAYKIRLEADHHVRKVRAEGWRDNANHESEIALDDHLNEFDLIIHTDRQPKEDALALAIKKVSETWGIK